MENGLFKIPGSELAYEAIPVDEDGYYTKELVEQSETTTSAVALEKMKREPVFYGNRIVELAKKLLS